MVELMKGNERYYMGKDIKPVILSVDFNAACIQSFRKMD